MTLLDETSAESLPDAGSGDAPLFKPGETFGRYEIQRIIGYGGMSQVYEAVHLGLRKTIALKILTPEMAKSDMLRERFILEGERASRIRHPHVVDITDVAEQDGLPYLVMEYLHGETLGDLIYREAPLSLEQSANIMLPVIAATAAGHAQGIIHRDLKPDNILLNRDGMRRRPKVLDFGVSRLTSDDAIEKRLTVPNAVLGTPQYMAPEQARGETAEEPSDQFALGCVLYEMVTGELPRKGDTVLKLINAAAHDPIVPPRDFQPEFDPTFESVLMRAVSDRPGDRYASVREFGYALLPWCSPRARDYWSTELSVMLDDGIEDAPGSYDHFPGGTLDPARRNTLRSDRFDVGGPDSVSGITRVSRPSAPGIDSESGMSFPGISTPGLPAPQVPAIPQHVTPEIEPPRRRGPWPLVAGAVVISALTAIVVSTLSSDAPEPSPAASQEAPPAVAPASAPAPAPAAQSVVLKVAVEPSDAKLYLDGALLAEGGYEGKLPRDGRSYRIEAVAGGYQRAVKVLEANENIDVSFELVRVPRRGAAPPVKKPTSPEPSKEPSPTPKPPPPSDFTRRGDKAAKPVDTTNPYR